MQTMWTQVQRGWANRRPLGAAAGPLAWLRSRVSRRRLLEALALIVVFGLFLGLVQFASPDLVGVDGYYHIKLAYLMRTEGLKPDFPYLPLTILNGREFYDHHFLFHIALMPFTFGDLRLGAKLAAVVFAGLAFLSTWNLLRNQRIRLAGLWALGLLAVSDAFLYRMSSTRAQSLSLAVLMLALDWLLRRKYRRLVVLAGLYVWLYNAFPLLLAVGLAYVLAGWLAEGRVERKPLLAIGAGIGLGLLVNPYFPYNLTFAWQHILPKLVGATAVSVGSEWYPYDTGQLLANSTLALAAFGSGVLALGLAPQRADRRTLTMLLLAGVFGLMLFQARRFVEYFPAFALVFAAFAWSPLVERYLQERRSAPAEGLRARAVGWLPALVLVALIVPGSVRSLRAAGASVAESKPAETFAGAAAWLEANTPAGARVFQTDWDDFPRLFFHNTHNTYLVGLDPTYLQLYDADLYDAWVSVTRGRVERPSSVIWNVFGARYLVTDLNHEAFLEQAGADPGLERVYQDDHSAVYRLVGSIPGG
jgi:hypothetical protein